MSNQHPSKGLNIALWVAQGLTGALFLMAGFSKTFQPISELAVMLPWVTEVSSSLVRFIGISELLGGLGVLLPALLRIKPFLTSLAAAGLALIMVLAAFFHIARGEMQGVGANVLFMAVALFIVWGRTQKVPILSKS